MKLFTRKDNPAQKKTYAYMGYDESEMRTTVLEFEYSYGVEEYDLGTAFAQIAIGTNDVYKTSAAAQQAGAKIVREAGPLPGLDTKIVSCLDPDGWKTVFVDNRDFEKELEPAAYSYRVTAMPNLKPLKG
ncbi:hypothetical protein BDL97_05G101000 [Sphagnum fallax]|nr:hypothetical protein BDL97_05G101000 [Sphagnum fallax]KAH8962417.1 hypothetical protein BDL97_05G101000 [Sphagnum fallax]